MIPKALSFLIVFLLIRIDNVLITVALSVMPQRLTLCSLPQDPTLMLCLATVALAAS